MSASASRATMTAMIVATASFMQMLDASIIGAALPHMGESFGVDAVAVGAGIIVYVLAAAIFIPASSWIGDRFGARRVFVVAIGVFVIASVLCGLSTNLPMFVCARFLQGVAGAVMLPVGQIILVRSVDRRDLLRMMNISSAPMLVAPVLGPALGGFLTETVGWPWIFYINLPVGLLGVLAARFLPESPVERRPFDVTGFVLNAAALVMLLGGMEMLTGREAGRGLAIGIVAAGLVVGYIAVRHLLRAPSPLVSLNPFRTKTFRVVTGAALPLVRLPIGALLFTLPIMLQVGFGWSALMAGLALLSHASGDLLMKVFMTRTFGKFGYRRVLLLTTACMSVSIAACAFLQADTPMAVIMALLFFAGCARSFVMTGLSSLTLSDMAPALTPSAITLNQVAIQLASALSVSLATIAIDLSVLSRGAGSSEEVGVMDCRFALLSLAVIGFLALPALLRLPPTAGREVSGHGRPSEAD